MKEENPNALPSEIMIILGQEWRELPEGERTPYVELAAKEKIRFQREKKVEEKKEEEKKEENSSESEDDSLDFSSSESENSIDVPFWDT